MKGDSGAKGDNGVNEGDGVRGVLTLTMVVVLRTNNREGDNGSR